MNPPAACLQSLKSQRQTSTGCAMRLLMAETTARYYAACLLLALEFLHSSGLMHRDVSLVTHNL